ncbi:hypothetical protein ABVB69_20195 [Streptomyces sp. NPDC000349]|uniref:hypothetical protein n=1 Tax=unclassified Streptomyces TaxID=2593676 RepID=UPI00277EF2BD|nr:hypothetical protein [Streptomyces sp. DSM 40167]MDQ0408490.1 hypothetical protein [Streptomyces sp. DSM 40167]
MPDRDDAENETFEQEWDDEEEAAAGAGHDGEPDVLLDVPELHVEEISLHVENLQARVSLSVEVLELLKLNVGADVSLGRVELDIKGVQAQAMLKVRLDNVAEMVGRVLSTVDAHPQILEQLTSGLDSAAESLGGGAGRVAGELAEGAGDAVRGVGESAGKAVREVGDGAGEVVGKTSGRAAREASPEAGRGSGRAGRAVQRGRTARGRERQHGEPP